MVSKRNVAYITWKAKGQWLVRAYDPDMQLWVEGAIPITYNAARRVVKNLKSRWNEKRQVYTKL